MSSIFAQLIGVRGAPQAQVLEQVQAHLASLPLVPAPEDGPIHRELWVSAEVDGLVQIWESPGWLRPPPSLLHARLGASLPQARVDALQRALGRPPSWPPQLQLRLALQPHGQRAAMERLLAGLPGRFAAHFPLTRPDGRAELRCLRIHLRPPLVDDLHHRLLLELELVKGPRARPVVEELELGLFAPLGQDGLRLSGQQRGCCIPDLEAELTQQLELRLRLAQGALRQLPPARIRRPGALLRG